MQTVIHKAIFLALILVLSLLTACKNSGIKELKLQCNEEPFRSLKLPIKHANAVVQHAEGDVINGDHAILVRLVDSVGKEYFLAVLKDTHSRKYRIVIRALPLSWREERGPFGGIQIPDNLKIPEDLSSGKKDFEKIKSVDYAILDLINIMKRFRDTTDGYSNQAYEYLKNGGP